MLAWQINVIESRLTSGVNECRTQQSTSWFRGKCQLNYRLGEIQVCELYNWGDSVFRYEFIIADSITKMQAMELLKKWHPKIYNGLGRRYTCHEGPLDLMGSNGPILPQLWYMEYTTDKIVAMLTPVLSMCYAQGPARLLR